VLRAGPEALGILTPFSSRRTQGELTHGCMAARGKRGNGLFNTERLNLNSIHGQSWANSAPRDLNLPRPKLNASQAGVGGRLQRLFQMILSFYDSRPINIRQSGR
jgi:hypothetical protein